MSNKFGDYTLERNFGGTKHFCIHYTSHDGETPKRLLVEKKDGCINLIGVKGAQFQIDFAIIKPLILALDTLTPEY